MPYPGYLLNPGDMFQVDVERVLYATGAPKTKEQIRSGRKLHKARRRSRVLIAPLKKKKTAATVGSGTSVPGGQSSFKAQVDIEEVRKQRRLDMKRILDLVEGEMADKRRKVGAKRKIAIRALVRDVRRAMSTINRKNKSELDDQLSSLLSQLAIARRPTEEKSAGGEKDAAAKATAEEQELLRKALDEARENPTDDSKPYATPWRPRPYMSAFAFIPRYLEVNHNICTAVYLRHPVARKFSADVPSPFGEQTQQLAFNWYLRNGR